MGQAGYPGGPAVKAFYIVCVLVLVVAGGTAQAQETGTQCVVPMEMICLGEGPASALCTVPDDRFDEKYMLVMYQLNSDIAALAAYGIDHASDPDIKVFSHKIALERLDVRNDLRQWYWQYNNRIMPKPETARQEVLLAALYGCCGQDFDCRYAQLMIELMRQSEEAAELAIDTTNNLDLLFHARVAQRTNANEIRAFERWLDTGALR